MSQLVNTLIAGFLIVMVGATGAMILDDFAQSTGIDTAQSVDNQSALFEQDDQFVQLSEHIGQNEQVYKTTGNAVNLTGSDDSYIESTQDVNISGGSEWTISAWGHVDSPEGLTQMALVDINGRVIITYDPALSQWSGWYYDDGNRGSYRVNVSASGSEEGNLTNIQLRHNGTHLEIYRNNTLGETANTTGGAIEPAPVGTSNWDGRLEELRTFGKALNQTERQTVVNQPVQQLPDSDPTARAMFDQAGRQSQLLLYSAANIRTSNVSYSSGFAAQKMDSGGLLSNGDYAWREEGAQISALSGGELDGAPVAYVSYDTSGDAAGNIIESYTSFTGIMSAVPAILGILMIVGILGRLRQ